MKPYCCYIDEDGTQCCHEATHWIGAAEFAPDATHSCAKHIEDLRSDTCGETVQPIGQCDLAQIPPVVTEERRKAPFK